MSYGLCALSMVGKVGNDNRTKEDELSKTKESCNVRRPGTISLNPSNAKATFVQSTKKQRFLKDI